MKILQIHNYYKTRGGEAFVVSAEKKMLIGYGHEVIQLTADNADIKNYIAKRRTFYNQLIELIKVNDIDVAHIHNVFHIISNKIYKVLSKHNIPIVQTLHNFRFLCPNGLFLDNDMKICRLCNKGELDHSIKKRCYQNSFIKSLFMARNVRKLRNTGFEVIDQFIALSQYAKQEFILGGIAENKISDKANFIEDGDISVIKDGNYGLFLGRISKEKGIETLIKTFKDIDFKLILAGDGSYLNSAKIEAELNANISLTGYVSGEIKSELIANSSFLILPSICFEMFPITILEAYGYSKPVIASDLGGLPEIVIHGETGYIFKNNNSKDLFDTINRMIKNRNYLELGKKARQMFENKYTEEKNYRQLITIYEKVIKDKL